MGPVVLVVVVEVDDFHPTGVAVPLGVMDGDVVLTSSEEESPCIVGFTVTCHAIVCFLEECLGSACLSACVFGGLLVAVFGVFGDLGADALAYVFVHLHLVDALEDFAVFFLPIVG